MNCTASALGPEHGYGRDESRLASIASLRCLSVRTRQPTIPNDFGPIYINGGSVDFKGDFSCTGCTIVLTNKARRRTPRSATSRPTQARTLTSPRRRPGPTRASRSTRIAALRIARTATRSTAIRHRHHRCALFPEPGTAVQRNRNHHRHLRDVRREADHVHRQQRHRATSSRSLPTAAPKDCRRTPRRAW